MQPSEMIHDADAVVRDDPTQRAHDNQTLNLFRKFSIFLWWPTFLVAMPLALQRWGWPSLVVGLPLGVYLVMWAGLLRHEVWHRNYSRLQMLGAFNALSYLIFLDPRPYLMSHGPHHSLVHTPRDVVMFYDPEDIHDKAKLRRYFIVEAVFGNAAWEAITLKKLLRTGKITRASVIANLPKRVLPLLLTGSLNYLFGGARGLWLGLLVTLLVMWLASLAARHVQWIEHLGILADGTMEERSTVTRNLSNTTLFGRAFNVLTLSEAWNHTFHHLEPNRPLSGIDALTPLPEHLTVTWGDYLSLLRTHYRSLT